MIDLGAFGRVSNPQPIKWEYAKAYDNYRMKQQLTEWYLNPDALDR